MTTRTTTQSVVFARPFTVAGAEVQQPAGTYMVETDEELIEDISFFAYRRTATRIRLAADPLRPGTVETVSIDGAMIDAALAEAQSQ